MISNTSGNEVVNVLSSFQIENSDSFVKKSVPSKVDGTDLVDEEIIETQELEVDYEEYMRRCDERANFEDRQKTQMSINSKYKQAMKAYSSEKIDLTEIEINTEA